MDLPIADCAKAAVSDWLGIARRARRHWAIATQPSSSAGTVNSRSMVVLSQSSSWRARNPAIEMVSFAHLGPAPS